MVNPFDFNPFEGNLFDKIKGGLFDKQGFNQEQLLNMYIDAVVNVFKQKVDDLDKELRKMIRPSYNPYGVLGITQDTTEKGFKEAYRNKVKQHHPDKGGNIEDFKQVQLAYEVIKRMKGWK